MKDAGSRQTKPMRPFCGDLVAESVRATQIEAKIYGNLLPAGRDAAPAGQESNRWAEVWLKELEREGLPNELLK